MNKHMRSILLLLVVTLLVAACSETEKTPSGQEFTYIRKGKGEPGRKGEYILMNMSYRDAKDSVWFTLPAKTETRYCCPFWTAYPNQ